MVANKGQNLFYPGPPGLIARHVQYLDHCSSWTLVPKFAEVIWTPFSVLDPLMC